jgi:hemolysin activation/secretion protein
MTAYTSEQMSDTYAKYIGNEVALSSAWTIVDAITKRYRDNGYFLCRAYVPMQNIKNGKLIIKVVEGYIAKVEMPEQARKHSVVQSYINKLMLNKPTKIEDVEGFLLRLNDLPGYSFRAVISSIKDEEGQVLLTLTQTDKKGRGAINIDNFSSRYVGSTETMASYSTSLLSLQQTTISVVSGLPIGRLTYGALSHAIVIAPDTTLNLNISATKTYPGYALKHLDLNSFASSSSVGLQYQLIRQRQENLSAEIKLTSTDVSSDVLGVALARDHVRALRAGFSYDLSDRWGGGNIVDFALSRGIYGLGANSSDNKYSSRAGASPNFTKADLSISRLQTINENWLLFAVSNGQIASGTLYSSEQCGYGGQSIGRAYDLSEITGDQGASAELEVRYTGLKTHEAVTVQPYGFYDIGKAWNFADSQESNQSGASAGFGMRFSTKWFESGNI